MLRELCGPGPGITAARARTAESVQGRWRRAAASARSRSGASATTTPHRLLARLDAAAVLAGLSNAELIRQALDDRCERAEAAEERRRRLREGSGAGVGNLGE